MFVNRILGNVGQAAARFAGKPHDPLELTWRQCTRRAVRARTKGGREISVVLPPGVYLRHGDVLVQDEAGLVVVVTVPCDVWVAEFDDPSGLAGAALELGNAHVPVQVVGSRLITLPDGPARGIFSRYAASWRPEVRRFHPLRATIAGAAVRLSPAFKQVNAAPAP